MEKPLVTFDKITAILMGKPMLPDTSWQVWPDENWAIIGPNGSGKSSLCRVILGKIPVCQGRMRRDPILYPQHRIAYVSFGGQQQLMLREDREDAARAYRGTVDEVTTVREILLSSQSSESSTTAFGEIVDQLQIHSLLEKGIRTLSNGEIHKIMIARGLLKAPRLLILDEPFDGLDVVSRAGLAETIDHLMEHHLTVLLITHRLEELTAKISHVLCLKECHVFAQGPKSEILASEPITRLYGLKEGTPPRFPSSKTLVNPPSAEISGAVVEMKNVTVRYGEKTVLHQLNWTLNRGEHWAIVGPNGAGKSTLLSLIAADNLQAYANEIYLFGKKRGSGESIWEIKKKIGLVSAEFQIRYHSHISARQVILSGFFDSIGLYQRGTRDQRDLVYQWLGILDLEEHAKAPFDRLSQGQQRMVLLARAMVKSPLLLILDEPCQGLDFANRQRVLTLVDYVGQHTPTQILYVTHHWEENLSCITHVLQFEPTATGGYQTRCRESQATLTPRSS